MEKPKFLTREQILKKNEDLGKVHPIDVPDWGLVGLKMMSQDERDVFDQKVIENTEGQGKDAKLNLKGLKAALVAHSLCDEKGDRMFTLAEIRSMPSRPLEFLYQECQSLNGLTEDAIKDQVKN